MQTWSVVYIASAIPNLFLLNRVLRIKSSGGRTSRLYYTACLIGLLCWTLLDITGVNLPADQASLARLVAQLTFLVVSITVYLFVNSSIHFTRAPYIPENAFVAGPIILVMIAYVIDPFYVVYASYGWQGDIANPVLRYAWLGLLVAVMAYAFAKLFAVRLRVRDDEARTRLTFFSASFVLALIVGVALYLLVQLTSLPTLSSIGVNLSLLVSYPAFSQRTRLLVKENQSD